jgi:hypothetical protein
MTNPMQTLYRRLADAGLSRTFVRKIALPDWWEDKIARNPAGYAEALCILSDHLSIDLRALQDPNTTLECRPFLATRNKVRQGLSEDDLAWAKCLCVRAAQSACFAMPIPPTPVPATASGMRQIIGKDAYHVSLEALLDYCWSLGVPVLHVSQFPPGAKKPDGMVARVGGRYAVVLSKNSRYSAWLLFILAHELGHIALGHLKENGVFLDDEQNWTPNGEDEENQANNFAIELLTGQPDTIYRGSAPLTATRLADAARLTGQTIRVDPGVIALNYARSIPDGPYWGLAVAAMKALEPDADAIQTVHSRMRAHLNWDALSDESRDFLLRITGAGEES